MISQARRDAARQIRPGKVYRCNASGYEAQVVLVGAGLIPLWPDGGDVEYVITTPDRASTGKRFGDAADVFLGHWTIVEAA